MEIQSLSVCVPATCPNNCRFCVSKMHHEIYKNVWLPEHHRHIMNGENQCHIDFANRLEFARDNGCNTVILTSNGEPLMNMNFIQMFGLANKKLSRPFRWIEVQTSGIKLHNEYAFDNLREIGVTTISLSLSNMFSDSINHEICNITKENQFRIKSLCSAIKENGFNLRLSLNMNDTYNQEKPEELFAQAKELGANQVTFRQLYTSGDPNLPQNKWIREHEYTGFSDLNTFIKNYGRPLERLPFGPMRYSVSGVSTVVDDDCMSTAVDKDTLKYLILRPDCRLYTKWDDVGSLLF